MLPKYSKKINIKYLNKHWREILEADAIPFRLSNLIFNTKEMLEFHEIINQKLSQNIYSYIVLRRKIGMKPNESTDDFEWRMLKEFVKKHPQFQSLLKKK